MMTSNTQLILYNGLSSRFVSLLRSLGVSPSAAGGLLTHLLACYSEPHRKYHTLLHLSHILDKADEWGINLAPSEELAIFYHDIVYRVGSTTNEAESAEVLTELRPLVSSMGAHAVLVKASTIIRETARFLDDSVDESAMRVMDLDISSLADPWTLFCMKAKLIQEEFGQTPSQYCKGLQRFLEKTHIFHTKPDLEPVARGNIERYLLETPV